MNLELIAQQEYSFKELEENNYVLVKFNTGFSMFYHEKTDSLHYFKHYQPPLDKPQHRFYYQTEITSYKKNKEQKVA